MSTAPLPVSPGRVVEAGFADPGPHMGPAYMPGGWMTDRQAREAVERTRAIPGSESAAILATAAREYRHLLTGDADPKAPDAWRYLADDCHRLADVIRERLDVTVTDAPEPYRTPAEMLADISRGRFAVSRANSEHPIWSEADNVAFRIAHDVHGHGTSGGDFGWRGEMLACSTHAPLLDPRALPALACECIAQTGYAIASGKFADSQVCGLSPALDHLADRLGWR